ncbi:hypothetical protein PV721_39345 [Streptomyces sp. MB09-01]|uniref:hypothetical protein n=1 Tax=Streptomyces sp. MB09-01 TaxID=3028666 RepID=UPI0029BE2698|nr:hypothetical protein [Streptomyces sp. MB09-01]MDX3540258.1 hypothetical protein [Streptomyces sp. MB09-01]
MRYWINSQSTGNERFMMEVYTGWVQCEIGFAVPTTHFTMKSFLPLAAGTVRFYPPPNPTMPEMPGGIVSATAVASLGALAPTEDEANLFGVDSTDVRLEAQTFGGIGGSPQCLVLNTRCGLLNCHMFNYNYSVQVITRGEPNFNQSGIPTNQRPAGGANPEGGPIG